MIKSTKIKLTNIKDPDAFNEACHKLEVDEELSDKYFRFGEYADLELEVDENLNIVSAKFLEKNN